MIDHTYHRMMKKNGISIVFNLDLSEPVEISDFMSAFAGLGGQFERHIKQEHPDLEGEVKVYVKEVRKGSIEAELIPLVYNTIITAMDHHQIATKFVKNLARKINIFRTEGGRLEGASKTELTEIVGTIAALANDPERKATVSAVHYKKSKTSTEFSMEMTATEARAVVKEIESQAKEIDHVGDVDHLGVLLNFYQSNLKGAGKSGEKGIIEDITKKPLAVVYASDLAKERIKSEMVSGDRNIYKLGFFVNVNVQTRNGKPVAYRIKEVSDVIELPDDD